MPKTQEKPEFMTPTDLPEHREGAAAAAAAAVAPAALVGTWNNCDKATRGLVKVVIAAAGTGITVHAYGACTPTPCDWGTVAGLAYADNVSAAPAVACSAQFKFNFKQTILVGRLDAGVLVVETFDHFTDGSGRSDYANRCYMGK